MTRTPVCFDIRVRLHDVFYHTAPGQYSLRKVKRAHTPPIPGVLPVLDLHDDELHVPHKSQVPSANRHYWTFTPKGDEVPSK